ncbi:MAG: N-acetylmuramoyl-L-alanine amidase [Firmicutes bacterium]|nr:N-acetylmuramoyl-L-alanine amidase [Bacillota bacterium]
MQSGKVKVVFFLALMMISLGLFLLIISRPDSGALVTDTRQDNGRRQVIQVASDERYLTLDFFVFPVEGDFWQVSGDTLELFFHDIGAFPLELRDYAKYIDQHIHAEFTGDKVAVYIPLNYFPQAFRVIPRESGYRVQFFIEGLAGKRVAIDPGHGGHDPGAIGNVLGLYEKDVTLAVSLALRDMLQEAGVEVFMTRETDTIVNTDVQPGQHAGPDWRLRRDLAIEQNPDIFLSIHTNSYSAQNAYGLETFYNTNSYNAYSSGVAARIIHRHLLDEFQRHNRGIKHKNDAVLQVDNFAAVLIELLFISNPAEERIMARPDFPQRAARAIYNALDEYFAGPGGY